MKGVHASLIAPIRPDLLHSGSSYAVRNGTITGAVVGAVAGGYAASLRGFGCKLAASPSGGGTRCHAQRDATMAMVAGTVLGGITVGLVGAGLEKIWQWLD